MMVELMVIADKLNSNVGRYSSLSGLRIEEFVRYLFLKYYYVSKVFKQGCSNVCLNVGS